MGNWTRHGRVLLGPPGQPPLPHGRLPPDRAWRGHLVSPDLWDTVRHEASRVSDPVKHCVCGLPLGAVLRKLGSWIRGLGLLTAEEDKHEKPDATEPLGMRGPTQRSHSGCRRRGGQSGSASDDRATLSRTGPQDRTGPDRTGETIETSETGERPQEGRV